MDSSEGWHLNTCLCVSSLWFRFSSWPIISDVWVNMLDDLIPDFSWLSLLRLATSLESTSSMLTSGTFRGMLELVCLDVSLMMEAYSMRLPQQHVASDCVQCDI